MNTSEFQAKVKRGPGAGASTIDGLVYGLLAGGVFGWLLALKGGSGGS